MGLLPIMPTYSDGSASPKKGDGFIQALLSEVQVEHDPMRDSFRLRLDVHVDAAQKSALMALFGSHMPGSIYLAPAEVRNIDEKPDVPWLRGAKEKKQENQEVRSDDPNFGSW